MQNMKTPIPLHTDRLGQLIGQLRVYENIPIHQLAHGLCSTELLQRIETGQYEISKQLTDVFFQRLGKPSERLQYLLDWNEFQRWRCRKEIIQHLYQGNIQEARSGIQAYLPAHAEVLDQQFAQIVEINYRALSGAAPEELLPMVCDALTLTQPKFLSTSLDDLLLSRNEGHLFFAYLQLREQIEGLEAVSDQYRTLLRYLQQPRYDKRERVHLLPYLSLRIIEDDYLKGDISSALTICENTMNELIAGERLFAYESLLEWTQKVHDATKKWIYMERKCEKFLAQLKLIQAHTQKQPVSLLIPCEEPGHIYYVNHFIRDRRKLLGISLEALADGICSSEALSCIENNDGKLGKQDRKLLLQRLHLSGERYDGEIITDNFEDYLLRNKTRDAIYSRDWTTAEQLLSQLRENIPDIPTNIQYIDAWNGEIKSYSIQNFRSGRSDGEYYRWIKHALHVTLPLHLEQIDDWPVGCLSAKEYHLLMELASIFKLYKEFDRSLSILRYLKHCLQNIDTTTLFYVDFVTKINRYISNILGDLGRYQEANRLSFENIRIALDHQCFAKIEEDLYNISWNLSQQLQKAPSEKKDALQQEMICFIRQAYTAAALSGHTLYQQKTSFLACVVHKLQLSKLL